MPFKCRPAENFGYFLGAMDDGGDYNGETLYSDMYEFLDVIVEEIVEFEEEMLREELYEMSDGRSDGENVEINLDDYKSHVKSLLSEDDPMNNVKVIIEELPCDIADHFTVGYIPN
jgi:hypothetical protein